MGGDAQPDATALVRYDAAVHARVAQRLWAGAGTFWRLDVAALRDWPDGLVAVDRTGTPVGFVAIDPAGAIPFLVVEPAHRHRGIGRALLDRATGLLAHAGRTVITAGSGGGVSVWPGVPTDLTPACRLFERAGWSADHQTFDLLQDLADYATPAAVSIRARSAGLSAAVEPAGAEVLAFERREFSHWLPYYERPSGDVLVVRDEHGTVVAAALVDGPGVASPFAPMLGPAAATIGCVGVAAQRQGHGIGTYLLARASELLRQRGAHICHISWTTRASFYRRLGYRDWRSYLMYRRTSGC